MMVSKVKEQHTERMAYIYVRQSTVGQVHHHQESTERQYAFTEKAQSLGWSPTMIKVLDGDLGMSGAQTSGREDFKTLVADVSMGKVGGIFALEASRLARSSLEWHRLIELSSLTETLVVDEDGCYDPADFNDALLLGLKGTIAQAELHFLRARLQGGKLNKAKKGRLRTPLPVGLCYDEDRTVLDPDEEVQGAVRLVLTTFRETGSAYAVVQHFVRHGLKFPKRAYGGAWDGRLIWGHLAHARVCAILKNPAYAGAYVYGRYRSVKEISSDGNIRVVTRAMPMNSWLVTIHDHHEGYIPWEEFVANQAQLETNRTNGEETLVSGPAREGAALLQGLLVCGRCGRRLSVRYKATGGVCPHYECNWRKRDGLQASNCMAIRGDILDKAVADRVLKMLQPAQLKIAVHALEDLERRDNALSAQWRMRVENAEYQASLAERRYEEVDPSNRLVASTLESRWNDALLKLEQVNKEMDDFQRQNSLAATAEQKQKILALAENLPKLWHAPTTKAKDRKRMLRLLIKDITVEKRVNEKQAVLHLRWQGGVCEDIQVDMPPNAADKVRYPDEVVNRVRGLAKELSDKDIAETLNEEGRISAKGKAFTVSMIRWIRHKHHIPPPQLKQDDESTVQEVAQRFGVSIHVVYYWIDRGLLKARQQRDRGPYWIRLDETTEDRLSEWVSTSSRLSEHPSSPRSLMPAERGAL